MLLCGRGFVLRLVPAASARVAVHFHGSLLLGLGVILVAALVVLELVVRLYCLVADLQRLPFQLNPNWVNG